MMTIPCTLPRSRNSLLDLSKQHFTDQPVESTPVNRSEHEVNTPKHSYVGAMEEAQEPDRDILPINTSPEPVSQHAFSKCIAHS